jgi:hypothetical protein
VVLRNPLTVGYYTITLFHLTWFDTWSKITTRSATAKPHLPDAKAAREYIEETFVLHCKADLQNLRKMAFYTSVKTEFGEEPYLQLKSRARRISITRLLHSSSHDLRVV